jgi:hypothetical protein
MYYYVCIVNDYILDKQAYISRWIWACKFMYDDISICHHIYGHTHVYNRLKELEKREGKNGGEREKRKEGD